MGSLLDELNNHKPDEGGGADYAPAWRWENAGDGIEGVIVAINTRVIENHPDGYPIITVRDARGEEHAIHGMATVLKNEINERHPRIGDEFAVIFDGQRTSGAGRKFNAFRVGHRPAIAPVAPPQRQAAPQRPAADPWAATAQRVAGSDDIPF